MPVIIDAMWHAQIVHADTGPVDDSANLVAEIRAPVRIQGAFEQTYQPKLFWFRERDLPSPLCTRYRRVMAFGVRRQGDVLPCPRVSDTVHAVCGFALIVR